MLQNGLPQLYHRIKVSYQNGKGGAVMTNRMIKRKVFYIQLKLISPLSVSSGEDEWTDSDMSLIHI